MQSDSPEIRLATTEEVEKSTYESTAKDYFEVKKEGLKASTAAKLFWFISALVLLSTITPQLLSERHREELAEEIRSIEKPQTDSKMEIPAIQNEMKKDYRPGNDGGMGGAKRRPQVDKIKSIDLRTMNGPPPGSEVHAIFVSGGANGTVKVKLTEDLALNNDTYAHSGSTLIGTGSSTEQRLFVVFNRLVSPEGKSSKILAQAYDFKDRIRGIKGKKVSDQIFKIAGSSALIFLSGLSESLQDTSGSNPFLGQQRKSMRDAALGGVAQASSEHGRRMLDEMNNDTQIEVQKETELIVIFESIEEKNGS